MKQIVDKLNKIAKKINENVELSDRDLIIDSLDSITKAYGGTPNDSNLIVDKLEDIYNNISPAVSGNIEITENGENINVAPYATATVNVPQGGGSVPKCTMSVVASEIGEDLFTLTFNNGKYEGIELPDNTTTVINNIYYGYDMPTTAYMVPFFAGYSMKDTLQNSSNVSDLVNLTVNESGSLIVTDPTQDSSCTISATEFFQY